MLVWLVLLLPDFELLTGESLMLRRPLQNKRKKRNMLLVRDDVKHQSGRSLLHIQDCAKVLGHYWISFSAVL